MRPKYHVCYGQYPLEGGLLQTVRCDWREQCQYYPINPRWLAEHYAETETFGDGRVVEIHPPPCPPPRNRKEKTDARTWTPEPCPCPWFLPRPGKKERKTISTPFD